LRYALTKKNDFEIEAKFENKIISFNFAIPIEDEVKFKFNFN